MSDLERSEWKRIKTKLPNGLSLEALQTIRATVIWLRSRQANLRGIRNHNGGVTEMRARAQDIARHAKRLMSALQVDYGAAQSMFFREDGVASSEASLEPEFKAFLGGLQEIIDGASRRLKDVDQGLHKALVEMGSERALSIFATKTSMEIWEKHARNVPTTRGGAFYEFAAAVHEVSGNGPLSPDTLVQRVRAEREAVKTAEDVTRSKKI